MPLSISVDRPDPGQVITLKCVGPYRGLSPRIDAADHVVIFTHIPKAAGTSLEFIMRAAATVQRKTCRRVFGTLYRQFLGSGKRDAVSEFERLSIGALSADYLTGHLPFGVHARVKRPCLYVTVLREPVARLLSHFRFGVARGGWSIETPLDALFRQGWLIDNPQTRQIAGLVDPKTPCTTATLETALANLRSHYAVVGVAERFDEALKGLIGLLRWPDIAYTNRHVTRARYASKVEERVTEAARRYCELDSALYAHAAARPTPWSGEILAGTPDGTGRQRAVLLTSPKVRVNNKNVALLPAAVFDDEVCKTLRDAGWEIRLT